MLINTQIIRLKLQLNLPDNITWLKSLVIADKNSYQHLRL